VSSQADPNLASGHGLDAADRMEAAKRRLDRALNGLERSVATHSSRLRQTNASDVAALRSHAQAVEREKHHLVSQLQRLDAYLGDLEQELAAGRPPALPQTEA
jgi:uncharacterized protein YukE